jgi:P27 family predicted phage terminase small subunit
MGLRGPVPKRESMRQGHRTRPELAVIPRAETAQKPPIPRPPTGLLASSRRRWKAFWRCGVAQAVDPVADLHRIERWIGCVDEYERVNAAFKKGRLVKGSMGQPVLNPLAQYLQQLLAEINKAEAELGLTPLARMRLGIFYGQARLTAQELNRLLDEQMHEPREIEDWEAEWVQV